MLNIYWCIKLNPPIAISMIGTKLLNFVFMPTIIPTAINTSCHDNKKLGRLGIRFFINNTNPMIKMIAPIVALLFFGLSVFIPTIFII